jgi:hypothetical protein
VVEVHEMKMEGDVMKMRAIPALDLPAGKTVELKPGGYHVMLMDLKAPLAKGSSVPADPGVPRCQGRRNPAASCKLPVASQAPGAAASGMGQGACARKQALSTGGLSGTQGIGVSCANTTPCGARAKDPPIAERP